MFSFFFHYIAELIFHMLFMLCLRYVYTRIAYGDE